MSVTQKRETAVMDNPARSGFAFLRLPFELRQQVYRYALSAVLSITDCRLSRSPTLEEVAWLASRRGCWNLCLCSRRLYSETFHRRWGHLTVSLSKDGTSHGGDHGCHRLGNADQAFRRRIQHLLVTDPRCFGMCYGISQCSSLRTLTVRVDRLDGILLEARLMAAAAEGAVYEPAGRKLLLHLQVVEPAVSATAGMMINSGNSDEVQLRWRQEAMVKGQRHRFMFLGDLIPKLPPGCRVLLEANVVDATWSVLKTMEGFITTSTGPNRWRMAYEEDV